MRARNILTGILIVAVLAAGSFLAGARLGDPRLASPWDAVEDTARELQDEAARPLDESSLIEAAIEGMLEALGDPYAASLSPEDAREVEALIEGSIVGVGVWLREVPRGLEVSSVVAGSPADKGGLAPHDLVVRIDGQTTRGMTVDDAAALMRGPEGSKVRLLVRRPGGSFRAYLERVRIDVQDVEARQLSGGVGYLRLLRFGSGAADEVRSALRALFGGGATAIVLDLRGNAGGLADEAVDIASLFLDGGVVARFRGPGAPERLLRADEGTVGDFPLAVLVNGGSASASELLAGALQDRGRATIVGLRTFGKGSVLTVSESGAGSTIQYTTSFFFTPGGRRIEGRGIVPDVRALPGGLEDAQLAAAIDSLDR